MGLKPVVEDIGTIDENLRPLYVERDGKHVLDVDASGGWALEDVGGLKSALGRKTEELRTLRESLGDLDPSAARRALERVKELEALDPTKEADKIAAAKIEAEVTRLKTAHKTELETATRTSGEYLDALTRQVRDSEAIRAIAEAKGSPALLMSIVEKRTRVRKDGDRFVVEVLDPITGDPQVIDGQGNKKTIAHLLQELRQSDDYAPAFKGTESTGSGATQSASTASMGSGRLTPEQADSLAQNDPSGYAKARQEGRL